MPLAATPYDPKYDPLKSDGPGIHTEYAPSYWVDNVDMIAGHDGPVQGDIDADVAIIGSGFTGLSAALHLAEEHGIKAHILEANKVSWGCSTRNGGQVHMTAGRLKRSEWYKKWGYNVTERMHQEFTEAYDIFKGILSRHNIDCDQREQGLYQFAHRASTISSLEKEVQFLNNQLNYKAEFLSKDDVQRNVMGDHEAMAALYEPCGMSVHPAKLAFSMANIVRKLGAKIHIASPVQQWIKGKYGHQLMTPGGIVRAKKVIIATAAYTPRYCHSDIDNRIMPVLSNALVTRPLTDEEFEACGMQTEAPIVDTRILRFYYRILPDRRVLIGSRSALSGKNATKQKHFEFLQQGLWKKFPLLKNIQIDYSWWGWVDVSHDMMPRVCATDDNEDVVYAMGYGGSGVMYAFQAGRRMAQLLVNGLSRSKRHLPIFSSPLKHEGVLTPFRRMGQGMLYHWYHFKDEYLK